jgi:hypothetical protein
MNATRLTFSLLAALAVSTVQAASIYVFRTGNGAHDDLVVSTLTNIGHAPTLGQAVNAFTNINVISDYDAVYLQANHNYGFSWSTLQQQTMMDYVSRGGGLITAEWILWMAGSSSNFSTMRAMFPVVETSSWDTRPTATFTQTTADPIINQGLPLAFTSPTSSIAGVATLPTALKANAKAFYKDGTAISLSGWNYGNGRVAMFYTVNGISQLNNANFQQLMGNTFEWATQNPPSGPGVTGRVILEDYDPGLTPVPVASFIYRDIETNIPAGRVQGSLTSNGTFNIPGPTVPGTYRLYAKATHWLRAVKTVTTTSSGTPNVGNFSLKNGDIDGDNEVSILDYIALSQAFGSEPGFTSWNINADLDGDLVISILDYLTLSTNFGLAGA